MYNDALQTTTLCCNNLRIICQQIRDIFSTFQQRFHIQYAHTLT